MLHNHVCICKYINVCVYFVCLHEKKNAATVAFSLSISKETPTVAYSSRETTNVTNVKRNMERKEPEGSVKT